MYLREIGIDQTEIDFDLGNLDGLCFEVFDGWKDLLYFAENFFHLLWGGMNLIELNRIEFALEIFDVGLYLQGFNFILSLEFAQTFILAGLWFFHLWF